MQVIRDMGIFAAIGLGVALVSSFVFMACAYRKDDKRKVPSIVNEKYFTWLRQSLEAHKKRWWLLTAFFLILAVIGLTRVKSDTYTIGYLPDDHWVVENHA